MSTERFSVPPAEIVDVLSLREQARVRAASVIDEQRSDKRRIVDERGHHIAFADWVDPASDMKFQLQQTSRRSSPESVDFVYKFVGYTDSFEDSVVSINYDTRSVKMLKRNQKGNYQKCNDDDIQMLLQYLALAPVGELEGVEDVTEEFEAIMRVSEIPNQDPLFRAELKRTFAALALRLLRR